VQLLDVTMVGTQLVQIVLVGLLVQAGQHQDPTLDCCAPKQKKKKAQRDKQHQRVSTFDPREGAP
jgi:hypothetical protein